MASPRCHLEKGAFRTGRPQHITWAAWPCPSNIPGFPLTVDKQVVKEEEGSLLDVACRDLQQSALKEELGADVCEVRALGRGWRAGMSSQEHTCLSTFRVAQESTLAKATQGRKGCFLFCSPSWRGAHDSRSLRQLLHHSHNQEAEMLWNVS